MQTWNYRIIRNQRFGYLEIKEVYYDENGKVSAIGDAPAPSGENLEDLKECFDLMKQAIDREILDEPF